MPEQPDAATTLEGERKTVTALFADIKGSMDLMEDLDPEEARAIVDPAIRLMIDAALRYDGYVVQSTGDGIFALFGAPVAHEDHPQRALYSALRMQDEVKLYAERLRAEQGVNLQVRVGVNTGEVVVRSITTGAGQTEYTPIGHSTSLASRLQTLANPGSIAVSETVRKLVEGYFLLKPLGPARIKGVSEPVNVHEVTGLGPLRTRLQRAAGRGLTKFVGRERELEALRHAAEQAKGGRGQVVAAIAEAGAGKSRLYFEFTAKNQSGWMALEAFSVTHGKASAYLPVIDLLHNYFKIASEDNERTRREKVAGKITMLDRSLEDTLPYLFSLLGIVDGLDPFAQMDGQIKKRRTLEAIKRIVLRESLNQPLMVIFEDLHWIDEATQEFLNLLSDSLGTAKILLLVNYRPEYSHQWSSKTYYTQLRLDPLGVESAEEMLLALLGDGNDLIALKRLIIERTEGNPFFIEEIVQALFEDGILLRNGSVKLAKSMNAVKVPTTVQAVLAARIDRLLAEEKELLQTLAVLGREFPLGLVKHVTLKPEDDLNRMLGQLQVAEFIYEQPAVGDVEYIFKHALTQEVAYNSLLADRRRALHEHAAHAIEEIYAQQPESHYGDLAHHFLRANNAAKAIEYAQLAAEEALNRGVYGEATGLIETALELIDKLPEGNDRLRAELALRGIESVIAHVSHGSASPERERAIRRMCELGESIGEADQLLPGLLFLSQFYFVRGEPRQGLAISKRCLELAEGTQEAWLLTEAHSRHGLLAYSAGNFREAVSHSEQASLYSLRTDRKISQVGFLYSTVTTSPRFMALQLLGRVNEALNLAEEELRHAREAGHLFSLSLLLSVWLATLRRNLREPQATLVCAEEGAALSADNGFRDFLNWGKFNHGWALTELGQRERGVAEMETALTGLGSDGASLWRYRAVALLAQSYARMGRTEEALAIMNDARERAQSRGENVDEAETLRLKGEILLLHNTSVTIEAEQCFRNALEVARAQEAKWWELRASVSLARLLDRQGKRNEARLMLADIYNWFTEGFETSDLKDAKALLDRLDSEL
jgi:class 3 adenylate cyclase/tetratricopeptide (TPR) repeat protein